MKNIGPYMKLISAIIKSGEAQNDEAFLRSGWCRYLRDTLAEYEQERSGSRGQVRLTQKDTFILRNI